MTDGGPVKAQTKQNEKKSIIPGLIILLEKLPQGEQFALLGELEERFPKFKRKHNRKAIRSDVECQATNRFNKGLITNISAGGVYIETHAFPSRRGDYP